MAVHHQEIEKKLINRPFEPFDIVLSSGERYRIGHPDVAVLTKHALVVLKRDPKRTTALPDYAVLSYLHITALDPVNRPRTKRSA
jgi:hypothetical protein